MKLFYLTWWKLCMYIYMYTTVFTRHFAALISVNGWWGRGGGGERKGAANFRAREMTNYWNCKRHYICSMTKLVIYSVLPRIGKLQTYRSWFANSIYANYKLHRPREWFYYIFPNITFLLFVRRAIYNISSAQSDMEDFINEKKMQLIYISIKCIKYVTFFL